MVLYALNQIEIGAGSNAEIVNPGEFFDEARIPNNKDGKITAQLKAIEAARDLDEAETALYEVQKKKAEAKKAPAKAPAKKTEAGAGSNGNGDGNANTDKKPANSRTTSKKTDEDI